MATEDINYNAFSVDLVAYESCCVLYAAAAAGERSLPLFIENSALSRTLN